MTLADLPKQNTRLVATLSRDRSSGMLLESSSAHDGPTAERWGRLRLGETKATGVRRICRELGSTQNQP